MSEAEPAKERLREAIMRLRSDIDRVEFWADAMDRLAQPIPDYQATRDLSRHLLPSTSQSRHKPEPTVGVRFVVASGTAIAALQNS